MKDEKDKEINGLGIVLAVDAILERGDSRFISNGTFHKSDFDEITPRPPRLTKAHLVQAGKRMAHPPKL